MSCHQCIIELQTYRCLNYPPLQNPNEHTTAPERAMQIDLVPEVPPSGCYENNVIAMDVFSRSLYDDLTSNQEAETIDKLNLTL